MNLAVIPARGGSKRIPRKNILPFRGKPMIAWPILTATQSGLFDKLIVSTDDSEIAEISLQFGAEVPFSRPAELADDHAGITEVVAHATDWALQQNFKFERVCCLLPTAPLIQEIDLAKGLEVLQKGDWSYCFSVTEFAAPVYRAFQQTEHGGIRMLYPQHFQTRSQDLPQVFHDAGQFYWGTASAWLQREVIFSERSFPLQIPHWRVQDIDTADDWKRAEMIADWIQQND